MCPSCRGQALSFYLPLVPYANSSFFERGVRVSTVQTHGTGHPPAWTLFRSSKHFCIATQQRCDLSTQCGAALGSPDACERAATELGLANVSLLHHQRAPSGCFVDEMNRTIFFFTADCGHLSVLACHFFLFVQGHTSILLAQPTVHTTLSRAFASCKHLNLQVSKPALWEPGQCTQHCTSCKQRSCLCADFRLPQANVETVEACGSRRSLLTCAVHVCYPSACLGLPRTGPGCQSARTALLATTPLFFYVAATKFVPKILRLLFEQLKLTALGAP